MSTLSKPRSVGVRFLEKDDSQFKDVIELLQKHGVNPRVDIEGIARKGKGACEVTFRTQAALTKFAPILSSDRTVDVEQYGSGITVVTAVGIPVELDDNFVRHRLKGFGVVKDARFLTHANLGFPEIKTGVRQYKIEIRTHLPNSMRIGNNTVSFHYNGQPRICHKCGSPDHFVADCQAKKCFRCHELGHLAADCKSQVKCNVCGESGHPARACPLSFANRVAVSTAWARAPAPQVSAQPDQDNTKEKSLVAAISDEEGEDGDEDKEREEDLESVDDYASSDEEESIFRPHKDDSDVEGSSPIVSKPEKFVGARPKAVVSAPTADPRPKPAQDRESPKPAQAKESGMEMEVAQGGGELADSQTDMFVGSAEEPANTGSLILAGLPEDGANKLPDSGKLTEPGTSLGLELPLSEELVIDQFTSTSSGEESNSGKRTKGRNSRTSRKSRKHRH
ncbi:zinc finger protein [Branchiostoma belcheri]|nr:zinc finger protein [Branchiostoma belcheri]KAI8478586.1 zinc finger protein [Branchiostoma belcheri]